MPQPARSHQFGLENWLKRTGCSCRGPEFNSQHSHGSSQLSVTLVPEYLTPSHRHKDIHGGKNTKAHEMKINKKLKKEHCKTSNLYTTMMKMLQPPPVSSEIRQISTEQKLVATKGYGKTHSHRRPPHLIPCSPKDPDIPPDCPVMCIPQEGLPGASANPTPLEKVGYPSCSNLLQTGETEALNNGTTKAHLSSQMQPTTAPHPWLSL